MSLIVKINEKTFNLQPNISILQACEIANVIIPRFCYHERLSVAGNCRMCLVEVDKMPKLQVSCSVPITQNMVISTESPSVKKAREGVLEFLLINHPLDCPICDQGGECDLQDQSLIYGGDRSRFKEFKRATEDKDCGPLIKTVMTRCIHCTRCVRFANEVVGVPVFGTSGRGNSIEIGTYLTKVLASELSGNIIDLCPVGALTSKPYAFLSRPWELTSVESIDLFDSVHSNIRVDVRGYDIMRILPRLNEAINEEWISDKARFSFDGLLIQRLTNPLLKDQANSFIPLSWNNALKIVVNKLNDFKNVSNNNTYFSIGDFCDLESLVFAKRLNLLLNSNILNESFENHINSDYQSSYKFNSFIKNIVKSDLCFLIGINPRIEGVIINYHLRKRFLMSNFVVGYIGSSLKLTFPAVQLGNSLNSLILILEGKENFCKLIRKAKNPIVIVGRSFQKCIKDFDLGIFLTLLKKSSCFLNNIWNGFNYFHNYTSSFSTYDLSLNYSSFIRKKDIDLLYIIENTKPLPKPFLFRYIIFQGHHGCANAQKANIILPSCSFVEKTSLYINCEGRFQFAQASTLPLNLSKPGSVILYNIFNSLVFSSNYKFTNDDVTSTENFYSSVNINEFTPFSDFLMNNTVGSFFNPLKVLYSNVVISNFYIFSGLFDNFYKTDIISENSVNMTKCTKFLLEKNPFNY